MVFFWITWSDKIKFKKFTFLMSSLLNSRCGFKSFKVSYVSVQDTMIFLQQLNEKIFKDEKINNFSFDLNSII